jgi:pimeloyl-CoA synthetase
LRLRYYGIVNTTTEQEIKTMKKLSPEAKEKQRQAQARWHAEQREKLAEQGVRRVNFYVSDDNLEKIDALKEARGLRKRDDALAIILDQFQG